MNNSSDMISQSKLMTAIYAGKMSTATSCDYIIPEDASDTAQILTSEAAVTVDNIEIGEKYVEISGKVTYDVLLLGEDDSLYGVTYTDDFKSSVTNDQITKDSKVSLSRPCVRVISKLVNPRKIGLCGEITIPINAYSLVDPQAKIDGIETLNDEVGIQRQKNDVRTLKMVGLKHDGITVSHDIELDGNSPAMKKILYRHMDLVPYEIKGRNNNIETRIQANVTIIYLTEEGNVFSACKSFIIDNAVEYQDPDTYEWSSKASFYDLSTEIAANSYGEMKVIEIDFIYDIELIGSKNVLVTTFSDVYSTDYEYTSKNQNISVHNIKRTYSCSLSVNTSASRDELEAQNARNVLTASARIINTEIKYLEAKNKLVLNGEAEVNILCENATLGEDDNKYGSFVYKYPFKSEFECYDYCENDTYIPILSVTDIKYRADSSKLYCDFEAAIKIASYSNCSHNIITEMALNKEERLSRVNIPFTLCYPCGKESLWDIAKYYKITKESIISSNSLESDDITDKKVLLIPQFSKKDILFSKVI